MDRIVLHAYYTSETGNPADFACEMQESGLQAEVKAEEGCIEYDYYVPLDGSKKVLLIEGWKNAECLERHKNSDIMARIKAMKARYGLETVLEKYE